MEQVPTILLPVRVDQPSRKKGGHERWSKTELNPKELELAYSIWLCQKKDFTNVTSQSGEDMLGQQKLRCFLVIIEIQCPFTLEDLKNAK